MDRLDDPRSTGLETRRLAFDEYDRPLYGGTAGQFCRESIRVHEVMTHGATSVSPETAVAVAARLMEECDCGALPVLGDDGVLVGMVTDRDIALRVVASGSDSRRATVGDCMTPRVFSCYANESLAECMRQMGEHQVRRMPIIDDAGRLVGMVSQGDLARDAARRPLLEQKRAVTDVVAAVSEPPSAPYR